MPDKTVTSRTIKALLIQERPQASGHLEKYLRKCGCECTCAVSYKEACSLLGTGEFGLVLSPMRLHNDSLYPLLDLLHGSHITLFFWYAVEGGCFWLPALRQGQNCFGSALLMGAIDFGVALDQTIQEIQTCAWGQCG